MTYINISNRFRVITDFVILSVCMSVGPWPFFVVIFVVILKNSKTVRNVFFDGFGWFLMILDDFWRFLPIFAIFFSKLAKNVKNHEYPIFDDFGRFLPIFAKNCQKTSKIVKNVKNRFLTILDDFWRFLPIFAKKCQKSSKNIQNRQKSIFNLLGILDSERFYWRCQ